MTISDSWADLRAATPSNAAEACGGRTRARRGMDGADERIRLGHGRPPGYFPQGRTGFHSGWRTSLLEREKRSPDAFIHRERLDLDRLSDRLRGGNACPCREEPGYIFVIDLRSGGHEPPKVLSRGFSDYRFDGRILRDAGQVSPGDRVAVPVERGGLDCIVEQRMRKKIKRTACSKFAPCCSSLLCCRFCGMRSREETRPRDAEAATTPSCFHHARPSELRSVGGSPLPSRRILRTPEQRRADTIKLQYQDQDVRHHFPRPRVSACRVTSDGSSGGNWDSSDACRASVVENGFVTCGSRPPPHDQPIRRAA